MSHTLGQNFFGVSFSDLGSGGGGDREKISEKELVGLKAFLKIVINISRPNSKTRKGNQQSVLNL